MLNIKDGNPKDAVGTKKAPMSTVPTRVMFELGLAMLEGARKYSRHNYRVSGVRASVYYDAALRHLAAFWEGEDADPDSGMPHVVKAIACLAVLRDSQHMGNWIDDRPPRLPDGLDLATLNRRAAEIIGRYPDAKEPYTQSGRDIAVPTCGDCAYYVRQHPDGDGPCGRLYGVKADEPSDPACFTPKGGA